MDSFVTLPAMIQQMMNSYHNAHALNYRVEGHWESMSTELFVEQVRRLTLGLHSLGVRKGMTIGILAPSSPHWLIVDLAIMNVGAVSVPMFAHISEENFQVEVANSEMEMLFVLGGDAWTKACLHRNLFEKMITYDVIHGEEGEKVIDFEAVLKAGDKVSEKNPELYAQLRDAVQEDDLATIIYTSGSTGQPKGVELTQRNLVSQIKGGYVRFPLDPRQDRILSLLPLAHVFERTIMYYYISTGVSVYFVDDVKKTAEICREVHPTQANMVPLVIERIYARIKTEIEHSSFLKRKIGQCAFLLAKKGPINLWRRILFPLADFLVYRKVRKSLGGAFRVVVVGGAPLDPDLCSFFIHIGVPLYQGYGLTETSPVLCCNYFEHNKPGTVGPPYPNVEIALTDEGEIITRGPNVMRGYHRDPERTARVFDADGWLHTGDKGTQDAHGFISVTGRIKEIMKTAGGKMVVPIPIEQTLCKSPLIEMAMVIAEGQKFVSCLIFPDENFLDTPFMRKKIDRIVAKMNTHLNEWEKVREYRFIFEPLTVETGELTPTLKIRRNVVQTKYQHVIDMIYEEK